MLRNLLLAALVASLALPADLWGIPAFARRYKASCLMCHDPVPKLNAFGETFAGNGFRMAAGEEPRDTVGTGDPLLALASNVPLAVRVDAYMQAFSKGNASTDFQAPYIIKVLASGPISRSISYYMYINLLERGEFGGFEDAILVFNDLGGAPVDLNVGQFQVSDPLFKRELRLMFEDYVVYRANIGEEPVNLTYDRGLLASADVLGFTLTGQLLNGNGIDAANSDRRFDDNGFKNLAGHITRDLAGFLRLGAFGYYGKSESEGEENKVTMIGGDGTLSFGIVEVNGQYLHREDTNPTFSADGRLVKLDGGFVEVVVRPAGSRVHAFGLYNLVTATAPLLNPRVGSGSGLSKYESWTGGVGYLLMRNMKMTGELTWDTQLEQARWSLGFVTAF
jgi:hypothetical protein